MKRSIKYTNLEVLDKSDKRLKQKKRNSSENGSSQLVLMMRDLEVMVALMSRHASKISPSDEGLETESKFTSLVDYAKYRSEKIQMLDSTLLQTELVTDMSWDGSDDSKNVDNASKFIDQSIELTTAKAKDYTGCCNRKLSMPNAETTVKNVGMLEKILRRSMSLSNLFTFTSRKIKSVDCSVENHMNTAISSRHGGSVQIGSV